MKKLVLMSMLIFALAFTACVGKESADTGVADGNNQEQSISAGYGTFGFDEQSYTYFEQQVSTLSTWEFIYNEEWLKEYGLKVKFSDYEIDENNIEKLNFNLTLTKDDKSTVVPLKGDLRYSYDREDGSVNNMDVYWGSINICNNEIIITQNDKVEFWSLDTLEKQDKVLTTNSDDGYYISTTGLDDKYITSYYQTMEKQGFIVFDDKGNCLEEYVIPSESYNSFYHGCNRQNEENSFIWWNITDDINYRQIEWITPEQVLIKAPYESYMYNLKDNARFYLVERAHYIGETADIVLYDMQPYDGKIKGKAFAFAVRYQNGKVTDILQYPFELHPWFGEDNDANLHYEKGEEDKLFVVTDSASKQTVIVDFISQKVHGYYNYTLEDLNSELAKYSDGTVSLWNTKFMGGGDYGVSALIAKNEQTNQIKFLGIQGGMYGGDSDNGFFKNGDIYVFEGHKFTIHSKDLSVTEPIFELTDKFPLGYNLSDEINERRIFAVRRDPEKFDYIVVYAELMNDAEFIGGTHNEYRDYTYKVGLLDTNGVLVKSYDTGITVKTGFFGYLYTEMYLENSTTIHVTTAERGVFDKFAVDITTGECINLYEAELMPSVLEAVENINDIYSFKKLEFMPDTAEIISLVGHSATVVMDCTNKETGKTETRTINLYNGENGWEVSSFTE